MIVLLKRNSKGGTASQHSSKQPAIQKRYKSREQLVQQQNTAQASAHTNPDYQNPLSRHQPEQHEMKAETSLANGNGQEVKESQLQEVATSGQSPPNDIPTTTEKQVGNGQDQAKAEDTKVLQEISQDDPKVEQETDAVDPKVQQEIKQDDSEVQQEIEQIDLKVQQETAQAQQTVSPSITASFQAEVRTNRAESEMLL